MNNVRLQRVLSNVGKYRTKTEMFEAAGYSHSYAKSGHVQETAIYKKVMADITEKLNKERDRLLNEMTIRDLEKEEYSTLVSATEKLSKLSELLGGGATERTEYVIKEGDRSLEPTQQPEIT